ncbi:MAG: DNA topoisomerase subunit B [Candidatus Kaiserbacteria bacterium]|nr:DNA topoisomerase subunit B [Candidatus Kaiserbacteria bacterium]
MKEKSVAKKKNSKVAVNDGKKQSSYSASDITVLEGLEAVRRRPGMYIGTTGIDGLYHLIWEVFDNSRDEAMAGHADEIEVVLLPDDVVRVADNGRGIPTDIHPKTKVSALETIMTTLHAGGKFGDGGYKVSGGLHGVGVSVVNALSTEVLVKVHREKTLFQQEYHLGKPIEKVKKISATDKQGTVVQFRADPSVFTTTEFSGEVFDPRRIRDHMRNQAFLVKSLHIRIIDARKAETKNILEDSLFIHNELPEAPTYSFFYDSGLTSFVRHHNSRQKPIHQNIFYTEEQVGDVGVEIALQYVDDISPRLFAFGNTIPNTEGGTHVTGFKTALTRTINAYAKDKKLSKDTDSFTAEDALEGITAIVSVKLPEIQFEGQTKAKLGSVEARSAVQSVFNKAFKTFLEEHPADARNIVTKVSLALQARKAARAVKDSILRKGAFDGMTLPGKLADCQSRNRADSELFIVEGESAGGTAKQGRDRRTQAVLPLRGKILNVERVRIDRMMSSEEIKALAIALGTSVGDSFDIEKLRYDKVIIATDADVDGAHIRTLLLTLFFRHFKPLIESGNIYFAQPPLYKVAKGKDARYAYSDQERDAVIAEFTKKKTAKVASKKKVSTDEEEAKATGVTVQRYKGLGEMNFEELRDTTMNTENRVLKRVSIEDAENADRTFDMLMGSEVAPRKAFIQENATYATLDV